MKTCGWEKRIEALHDGVTDEAAQAHLAECPHCTEHTRTLESMRMGVQAVCHSETIGDAQFNAFMAGIREEINGGTPAPRRGFWAMASLSTAALVIALSVWGVIRIGLEGPAMIEVEAMETELEGTSLEWMPAEDEGVPTLWVNMPKEDTW